MVMTDLEAHVERESWQKLEEVYGKATRELDPGIVQTYLVHSKQDKSLWRIITLWESQQALDAMRQSLEIPRGVLIFRAAGSEPVLTNFDVISKSI